MSEEKGTYQTKVKTIFRTVKNEDHPFVMMDRRPIESPGLSWGAKGVLAYLLSRPDNWTVRLQDLVNRSTDGVYKIRGYIKELSEAGHIYRKTEIDPKTKRFVQITLEVYELPFTTKPVTNLPQAEKPQAENLMLNDNESLTDNEINNMAPLAPQGLDWKLGHEQPVTQADLNAQKEAEYRNTANLIAMGSGINSVGYYGIALAFMKTRGIVIPNDKCKGQRKPIKNMLEAGVTSFEVEQATKQLMDAKGKDGKRLTIVDLYAIEKTAIGLANTPKAPATPRSSMPKFVDGRPVFEES